MQPAIILRDLSIAHVCTSNMKFKMITKIDFATVSDVILVRGGVGGGGTRLKS